MTVGEQPVTPSPGTADPPTVALPDQRSTDDVALDVKDADDVKDSADAEGPEDRGALTDHEALPEDDDAEAVPGRRRRLQDLWWRSFDRALDPSPGTLAALVYIGITVLLTWQLLFHPLVKVLQGNPYDQYYFEWQFAAVQHALFHFQNPLFNHGMNAPDGMNVEGNPQIIGPAAVLAPIPALFGAS